MIKRLDNFNFNLSSTYDKYQTGRFFKESIFQDQFYPYKFDEWNNRSFTNYGKVDGSGISIYPRQEYLKVFQNNSNNQIHTGLSFVVDAFSDLVAYQKRYVGNPRTVNNQSIYIVPNIQKSHKNIDGLYIDYLNKIYGVFSNTFLTLSRVSNIKTFDDFMNYFISYITRLTELSIKITRSGYISSEQCTGYVSGLRLGLVNADYKYDPANITNTYLSDPNFDAFVDSCRRYGFMVNKNAPWELVADLTSPAMLDYSSRYRLSSQSQIFSSVYHKVYETDIDMLKTTILSFYNTLVSSQQQIESVNIKNLLDVKRLAPATEELLNLQYSDEYFIRLYLYIKLLEERVVISQREFEIYYVEAIKLNKFIDTKQSLSFINQKVIQLSTEQKRSDKPALTDPEDLVRLLEQQREQHSAEQIRF
jgi:hypothetical protein